MEVTDLKSGLFPTSTFSVFPQIPPVIEDKHITPPLRHLDSFSTSFAAANEYCSQILNKISPWYLSHGDGIWGTRMDGRTTRTPAQLQQQLSSATWAQLPIVCGVCFDLKESSKSVGKWAQPAAGQDHKWIFRALLWKGWAGVQNSSYCNKCRPLSGVFVLNVRTQG